MAFRIFADKFKSQKTFRPQKAFTPYTLRYKLYQTANASLSAGVDLKEAVICPPYENCLNWIACHVVDFYNRVNVLYGTISDWCTEESCPVMRGGPKFEYHWMDDELYKKPTPMPAPKYIGLLMDWIESKINDPSVFPSEDEVASLKPYLPLMQKIMTRLFRVFVHVYIHHFDIIVQIGAEAHTNTCYKHFYYFTTKYNLIKPKELKPLEELTERIC